MKFNKLNTEDKNDRPTRFKIKSVVEPAEKDNYLETEEHIETYNSTLADLNKKAKSALKLKEDFCSFIDLDNYSPAREVSNIFETISSYGALSDLKNWLEINYGCVSSDTELDNILKEDGDIILIALGLSDVSDLFNKTLDLNFDDNDEDIDLDTFEDKAFNIDSDEEFSDNLDTQPIIELEEDTEKKANGKWVNKGKDGEHGEFKTKKAADAQRRAMFANGYHEEIENIDSTPITEAVDDFNFEVYIALSNLAKKYPNKTQADINKAVQIYVQNSQQNNINNNQAQGQAVNQSMPNRLESLNSEDIYMNEEFVHSFVESFKKNGNGRASLSEENMKLNENCSNIPDEGAEDLSEDLISGFVNAYNKK